MKAEVLKHDKRFKVLNNRNLGVQNYGEDNDYPQQVIEIVDASGTGKACLGTYIKFLSGKGFVNETIYNLVVNRKRQTLDHIEKQVASDYGRFGGFAIHVNYNANFEINEIQHIPFENVRLGKLDDEGHFSKVAIHDDWGKRYTSLKRFNKEDIKLFDLYDPSIEKIKEQLPIKDFSYLDGEKEVAYQDYDWEGYKGQVFYYSNQGEKTYPIPIFDSVLTDMSTEEGIANVSYRNARNNFFPAGMLIEYLSKAESEEQVSALQNTLLDMQGDTKAGKMLYVSVEDPAFKPVFEAFKTENFDKFFDSTRAAVIDSIGRAFVQPPILRAEDVGSNFGADLMKNAYNFYNSVIENDRIEIERIFTEIFKHWHEHLEGDFSIDPLSYNTEETLIDKLGTDGFNQVMTILNQYTMASEQKKIMIQGLFSLSDEEINILVPQTNDNKV